MRAGDTFGATETTPVTLPGTAFAPVDTGDPMPEGRDAVIMVEDVVFGPDGSATIHQAASPWRMYARSGRISVPGR